MNRLKFVVVLAADAALALSPVHVAGQAAAKPVSLGTPAAAGGII